MTKKIFPLLVFILCLGTISAQSQDKIGIVKGKIVNRKGREPISNAKIVLDNTSRTVESGTNGDFMIDNIPYGTHKLTITAQDFQQTEYNVKVDLPEVNVNFISMSEEISTTDIDDASFAEFDTEMANDAQVMPLILSSTKDTYDQIASYNFSSMRFRNRGYQTSSQDIYMNGIYMNDALTGNATWSLWGGLNDATRNQETATRLNPFEYGVGGFNGTTNINARASQIRKGFRSSAVTANGQYRYRLMLSYASGNLDNGWSYAFSASTRQGNNDFVKGVEYNSCAYFASVEKQINSNHRLALTIFGSPTQRGAQMAATQETYDLVDDNFYNPNWGYQDGKKRNARVRNYHEPVAILNYFFTPNDRTNLTISASYRFGKNGYSSLDWYDATDPRPDYYRNLPSYYMYKKEPEKAEQVKQDWITNFNGLQQIDWSKLYNINYNSNQNWGEYNGVKMGEGRSKYILSERHVDQKDFNFNVHLSKIIDNYTKLHYGIDLRYNKSEYYNKVKDLLGGKYWLNIDNFAERDFSNVNFEVLMNDMGNTKNLIAKKGDKYGYDYYANIRSAKMWGNLNINQGNWEGFAAAEIGYTKMWRDGIYTKGIFPKISEGNSDKKTFFTYTAKLGLTYKISGNQNVSLSGIAMAKAPTFQDIFVSPRNHNQTVKNLNTEKIVGGDLTYSARLPFMQARVSGFYTVVQDQTKLMSFYDDLNNAFTNFAMSGIDQRFMGLELGLDIPVFTGFSIKTGASFGDYIYTSNPTFTQTRDNSSEIILKDEKVYWKNFKVDGTPQFAASLGFNYRSQKYWFFSVDCGYYDDMYLNMSPLYRTIYALDGCITKDQVFNMVHQERFKSAFLLNASIGKSWYIKRKYNFGFNIQVKNILNDKDIKTGGFEQTRLRKIEGQSYKNRYDSKYFYLYGTTYYVNVYFRF